MTVDLSFLANIPRLSMMPDNGFYCLYYGYYYHYYYKVYLYSAKIVQQPMRQQALV
jgi:hypothetical protein